MEGWREGGREGWRDGGKEEVGGRDGEMKGGGSGELGRRGNIQHAILNTCAIWESGISSVGGISGSCAHAQTQQKP